VSVAGTLPLSVLDLSPITAGSSSAAAVRNTIDLAIHAERSGYRRHWVGEHHLSRANSSSSPAVLAALVAAATQKIRVGSGATVLSMSNPLVALEQFGTIAALYPGRVDLGVGRSPGPAEQAERLARRTAAQPPLAAPEDRASVGLLIPTKADYGRLGQMPSSVAEHELLWDERTTAPSYEQQVRDLLNLWRGEYRPANEVRVHAHPAEGADLAIWVLGSSAGESARVAGQLGLPFTAQYHQFPATVMQSVTAYRDAFQPSETLAEPYVMVSVDVLAADTDEQARRLAAPTTLCVLNIRRGLGYLPYPTPEEGRAATAGRRGPRAGVRPCGRADRRRSSGCRAAPAGAPTGDRSRRAVDSQRRQPASRPSALLRTRRRRVAAWMNPNDRLPKGMFT
jgi:alkanesulfonate monooxygenase SsuD/methylene tetrahydromethanopterin reductase-like flavin-dependent oxidoreductase (luciferase family)